MLRSMKDSLKAKLLLAYIFVIFGVALALGSVYQRLSQFVSEMSFVEAESTGKMLSQEFHMNLAVNTVSVLAQTLVSLKLSGMDNRDGVNTILYTVLNEHPEFLGTWTIWEPDAFDGRDKEFSQAPGHDATGRFTPYWNRAGGQIILDSVVGYEDAAADYYQIPRKAGRVAVVNPFFYQINESAVLMTSIAAPIIINGKFYGVVGVDIALSDLQTSIAAIKPYESGYVSVIANNGTYVAHVDKEQLGKDMGNTKVLMEAKVAIKNGQRFTMTEYRGGEELFRVFVPVSWPLVDTPWSFSVAVPVAKILRKATEVKYYVVGVGFIASLLIFFVLLQYISRVVIKPIQELVVGADAIAQGDFDQRLQIRTQDEIGVLAGRFNYMASNLRDYLVDMASAHERFYKAFYHVLDIIAIVRLRDLTYLEVNNAFYTRLGYSREEVIGHKSEDFGLWPMEEQIRIKKALKMGRISGQGKEIMMRAKSGEIKRGLGSADVLEINGEVCILYVWHDISERKLMEEELQKSKDGLEETVVLRTQELSAANQELTAMNQEMLAMNDSLRELNFSLQKEIEHRQLAEVMLVRTNDELGQALEYLQTTQVRLIQSEKMASLGTLIAGVAHEINTPLGNIVMTASYLRVRMEEYQKGFRKGEMRDDLTEYFAEQTESLQILENNISKTVKLMNCFKNVAPSEFQEVCQHFNVKKLLEDTVLILQPQLRKTALDVDLEVADNLQWEGYPAAMAQMVTHLVVNVMDHAYGLTERGTIRISGHRQPEGLVVEVSDDGAGMAEHILKKAFDPFFTTKRGEGRLGLGLYIVYSIVNQKMLGNIECVSQPGSGSRFTIWLPYHKGNESTGNKQIVG